MSAIEDYKMANQELVYAKQWVALIGNPYNGGGGGIGAVRSCDPVVMTIYHQRSNGDNNYHKTPKGLASAIATVVVRMQKEILAAALAEVEATAQTAANRAVEEHAAMMRDAGIEPLAARKGGAA